MIVESFSDFIRRDESGQVIVDSRGGPLPQPGPAVWVEALAPHTLENVGDAGIRVNGVEVQDRVGALLKAAKAARKSRSRLRQRSGMTLL